MKRGGVHAGSGRPKKMATPTIPRIELVSTGSPPPKRFKTALAWGMAQINSDDVSIEMKYRICAAIIAYQSPRIESVRVGKKEIAAEAAQEAATRKPYQPGPAPPALFRLYRNDPPEDEPA